MLKKLLLSVSILSLSGVLLAQNDVKTSSNSNSLVVVKDGVVVNPSTTSELPSATSTNSTQYNLPPRAVMYPKTNPSADYSEKLYGQPNFKQIIIVNQEFKSVMTEENYADMLKNDMDSYNYYKTAEQYFDALSDKVKALFTANEIWHIYYFDATLKNQLLTVQ
jgi:hypothetical protein